MTPSHAPQALGGLEGLAVATAADFILDLQKTAAQVGLDAPPEGWRAWAVAVRAAGQGDAPDDPASGAFPSTTAV